LPEDNSKTVILTPADEVARCVVALDVGGTVSKGAVFGGDHRAVRVRRNLTERHQGPKAVVRRLGETVDLLMRDAAAEGLRVAAVGVVVPGIVDEVAGVALFSANLGWRDVPIRSLLETQTGLPVAFGHDVRAGALAEGSVGAGRGSRHYLFLPVGTGIAAAMVLDGRPYAGLGAGGEIGHIVVEPEGRPCACGGRGCLETVASASAIAARYRARTGADVTAEQVGRRAQSGDAVATEVWDEAIEALAGALLTYTTMLDPELVIVGGGLAAAGDRLLQPLRERLKARSTFQRVPRITSAALGDESGCVGAALLAWKLVGPPPAPEEAHV
jgi:glucokinase